MSHSIARQIAVALLVVSLQQVSLARVQEPQPNNEVTIQPETRARLRLQSEINSKLSEDGDIITAALAEPLYVDGRLILARGVEFLGRVVHVAPARRGQRSSHISIVFEQIRTQSGEAPITAQVTAIDDWNSNEKLKADGNGVLKGGHRGEKTIENSSRGAHIGFAGSGAAFALGAAAGAGPRLLLGLGGVGLAAGMIAGLLLTKGSDIRVAPGAILRIKFVKPVSLPVIASPQAPPRSNQ
jgi:hypothetical protein